MTGGNPLLLQEYWEEHNEGFMTIIPPDYRNGYQYEDPVQPGQHVTGIEQELSQSVAQLHEMVGNVETKGYTIVFGAGATNLVTAAVYALSSKATKELNIPNVSLFVQTPYWFHYRTIGEIPLQIVKWNTSLHQNASEVIEIVTYPNNPTGVLRKKYYNTPYVIHDMVYYWPTWLNVTKKCDFDIMLFSMSKLTGHAGTRVGWALVKDKEVANLMQQWIFAVQLNGNSIEALYRTLVLTKGLVRTNGAFFEYSKAKMSERWKLISALFSSTSRFHLDQEYGFFYLWIQCLRPNEKENCSQVFEKVGLYGHNGPDFGATPDYVRFYVPLRDSTFHFFIEKIQYLLNDKQK